MNKAEILRYMRTNSKTTDENILSLVDRAMTVTEENSAPKTLYRIFDCSVTEDSLVVGDYVFSSKRLAANLNGCERVVMFGATLGTAIDRLIRVYSSTDTAMAIALQAASASKIEEVCDSLEEQIIHTHGVSLRQRYSPGYFDLDISEQKKFFAILELTKRIGLTLTDTCEMIPSKSVTAFIGID